MTTNRIFVMIFLVAPLIFILTALIESQIFLRIYGAGNIPTMPFLVTIAITCIVFRLCLSKAFDGLDKQAVR